MLRSIPLGNADFLSWRIKTASLQVQLIRQVPETQETVLGVLWFCSAGRKDECSRKPRAAGGTGHRAQGTGHWVLGTGHWALCMGHCWGQGLTGSSSSQQRSRDPGCAHQRCQSCVCVCPTWLVSALTTPTPFLPGAGGGGRGGGAAGGGLGDLSSHRKDTSILSHCCSAWFHRQLLLMTLQQTHNNLSS